MNEKEIKITEMTAQEFVVFQTLNQKMEANTISTKELEDLIVQRIHIIEAESMDAIKFHNVCLDLLKKLKEGKLR